MSPALRLIRWASTAAHRHAFGTMVLLAGALIPAPVVYAQGTAAPRVQFSAPQGATPGAATSSTPYGGYRNGPTSGAGAAQGTVASPAAAPTTTAPATVAPATPAPAAVTPPVSVSTMPLPPSVPGIQLASPSPGALPNAGYGAPAASSSPGISFSAPPGSPSGSHRVVVPSGPRVRPALWQEPQDMTMQDMSEPLPNPQGNGNQNAAQGADQNTRLGRAPEETNTTVQFLRQDSVLLDPGEYQFEVSLQYLTDESDFFFLRTQNGVTQIGEAQRRQRLMYLPLEFRYGFAPDLQVFVNVPFGWSNAEFDFLGDATFQNTGGIGDISAGFTKLLIDGEKGYPDILGTVSFSAPTGQADLVSSLSTPGSSLGQGVWTTTAALTFIHTYDPVVVFYGFGYQYRFENEFDVDGVEVEVEPGSIAFYRFGVGFAVNPRVTLSAQFFGSYIDENVIDGRRLGGSNREPMSVRLAATIVREKHKDKSKRVQTIEPFTQFGLTEGAIDSILGVSLTY